MKAIHHNNQLVAFARGSEIRLSPDLVALEPHHPQRRWAVALAIFACKVDCGQHAGPYTDARASQHARDLLLPTHAFAPLAFLSDRSLARRFAVPAEQIAARRSELGLVWN